MPIARDQLLTSNDAARLLQMDASSVVKWVNEGKLPAFRTPGGHRRIRADELLAFLKRHSMYIPAELGEGQVQALVVDDDENLLKALTRSMKSQEKIAVATCTNGIDALIRVGAERPDVLVMDVQLPDLDGFEVLRALKASPATKDLQVILFSGKHSPEMEKKALSLGAKALLAKPLTAEQFAQAINAK